jgi:hypothetical protein
LEQGGITEATLKSETRNPKHETREGLQKHPDVSSFATVATDESDYDEDEGAG